MSVIVRDTDWKRLSAKSLIACKVIPSTLRLLSCEQSIPAFVGDISRAFCDFGTCSTDSADPAVLGGRRLGDLMCQVDVEIGDSTDSFQYRFSVSQDCVVSECLKALCADRVSRFVFTYDHNHFSLNDAAFPCRDTARIILSMFPYTSCNKLLLPSLIEFISRITPGLHVLVDPLDHMVCDSVASNRDANISTVYRGTTYRPTDVTRCCEPHRLQIRFGYRGVLEVMVEISFQSPQHRSGNVQSDAPTAASFGLSKTTNIYYSSEHFGGYVINYCDGRYHVRSYSRDRLTSFGNNCLFE